jgi:hypothetical protein
MIADDYSNVLESDCLHALSILRASSQAKALKRLSSVAN